MSHGHCTDGRADGAGAGRAAPQPPPAPPQRGLPGTTIRCPLVWGVDSRSRQVLEANWSERHGFTMPNRHKYPYQWLWDSCFHAISWARLGDARAVREMEAVFRHQLPSGFVPNMGYQRRPHASTWMW